MWWWTFVAVVVLWHVSRISRKKLETVFTPDKILCAWPGSKHQVTNKKSIRLGNHRLLLQRRRWDTLVVSYTLVSSSALRVHISSQLSASLICLYRILQIFATSVPSTVTFLSCKCNHLWISLSLSQLCFVFSSPFALLSVKYIPVTFRYLMLDLEIEWSLCSALI